MIGAPWAAVVVGAVAVAAFVYDGQQQREHERCIAMLGSLAKGSSFSLLASEPRGQQYAPWMAQAFGVSESCRARLSPLD